MFKILVCIILCTFTFPLAAVPIHVIDGRHKSVVLKEPAQRIITLAPNLTEIAFAIGAGDKVVGVSSHSDYPKSASTLPVVSTYNRLNDEAVVALKPDLVMAWDEGISAQAIARLQVLHIPVYVASFKKLNDVAHVMREMGRLTGQEKQASKAAVHYEKTLMALRSHYHHRSGMKLFYEIAAKPLMTLNDETIVGEAIELCGGTNIFGKTLLRAPVIDIESIIVKNPDVIVVSSEAGHFSSIQYYTS